MGAGRGRRRRRRRSGRPEGAGPEAPRGEQAAAPSSDAAARQGRPRRRRRRGRRTGGDGQPQLTLEGVIRSIRGTPETLTAEADGQRLEDVIGDLQSTWGRPQYPQEYRLMIKVADDGGRAGGAGANGGGRRSNGVTRERAPAAPRVAADAAAEGAQREKAPRRRRRSRRGRRGRGSGSGSS